MITVEGNRNKKRIKTEAGRFRGREISGRFDAADDLVERMIATPTQRFKKKLTSLKHSRRFVRWGESSGLAGELETLLQDLKAGVNDPLTGVEMGQR